MKLTERIANTWRKNALKIAAIGLVSGVASFVAWNESHCIGSWRPSNLPEYETSYRAYEYADSIYLYRPVIGGFGQGPIIDRGKDGVIDHVGSITYSRMPWPLPIVKPDTPPRDPWRLRYQQMYDRAITEIRKSAE